MNPVQIVKVWASFNSHLHHYKSHNSSSNGERGFSLSHQPAIHTTGVLGGFMCLPGIWLGGCTFFFGVIRRVQHLGRMPKP